MRVPRIKQKIRPKGAFILLPVLTLAFMTGCQTNPFPEQGAILAEKPKQRVIPPAYRLDFPPTVNFMEGEAGTVEILAEVPEPGQPLVSVEGLPEGAVFDQQTMKITWTPGLEAANDSKNPQMKLKTIHLRVFLRSSEDPLAAIQRDLVFVVNDRTRPTRIEIAGINSSGMIELKEGEELNSKITIQNEDFPVGPFQLHGLHLPNGAMVKQTNSQNEFLLNFKPDAYAVQCQPRITRCFKDHAIELQVITPAGDLASRKFNLRVLNVQQPPVIVGPRSFTLSSEGMLALTVIDVNGGDYRAETTLKNPQDAGDPTLSVVEMGRSAFQSGLPYHVYLIEWSGVPTSLNGQTRLVELEACETKERRCTTHSIRVKFESASTPPVRITRGLWPMGEVKYLRSGEKFQAPISLTNGTIASAGISPFSPSGEVSWNGSALVVQGKTVGLKQFDLQITTADGRKATESFVYEVLPASWSKTLVLGDSLQDAEVVEWRRVTGSADIMNPLIQDFSERQLALRENLILGTKAALMLDDFKEIDELSARFKNIIISTPLLERLAQKGLHVLKKSGIGLDGRLNDGPSIPASALSAMALELAPYTLLSPPQSPLHLGGNFTGESMMPAFIGAMGSGCRRIFVLKDPLTMAAPTVGSNCPRDGGGRLVVLGFELGDVEFQAGDADLAKKWMKELVGI